MKLSDKQKCRIQTRHRVSIENYGYSANALFWSSRKIQEIRFQKIADGLPTDDQVITLLDVGCGFGDLKPFLEERGFKLSYIGIDVSPDMVKAGGFKYPGLDLRQGEIFDFDWPKQTFDFVVLSGGISEVVDDTGNYGRSVVKKMFGLAKQKLIFNCLNKNDPTMINNTQLQSYFPHEMKRFCNTLTENITVDESYLDNDFTVTCCVES